MAARPRRSHLRVREEEDVVAEARHRLESVCLKGLGTRQQKRHDSAPGLDVLYFVRGDPQAHAGGASGRSEEHTSELQSRLHLVCRLLLEKKKKNKVEAFDPGKKTCSTWPS